MTQTKTAFMTNCAILAIVTSAVNLLVCCEGVAAAEESATSTAVINYRSQTNLFATGQGTTPFLVDHQASTKTTRSATKQPRPATKSSLTLLSLAPVGKTASDTTDAKSANSSLLAGQNPLTIETEASAETTEFRSDNQPSITDLANTLQWTILLLTAVAAAVMGVHRLTKNKQKTQISQRMEYQGCLPVRGQFSMHLVTIIDRQFLVTTDRTGVKTVNALSEWDQFSTPIDPLVDDQFPELSMETKPRHHG